MKAGLVPSDGAASARRIRLIAFTLGVLGAAFTLASSKPGESSIAVLGIVLVIGAFLTIVATMLWAGVAGLVALSGGLRRRRVSSTPAAAVLSRVHAPDTDHAPRAWSASIPQVASLVAVLGSVVVGSVSAFGAPYAWRDRDWDASGWTSPGEFVEGLDVGVRPVTRGGETCTEYFALKDGLAIRTDCASGRYVVRR